MIYTKLTNEAMKIAYTSHNGQVDKCGIPYVFHPFHLAEQMCDEYTTCVALLHDVVEDTDVTIEELSKIFPKEVITAVELLTHRDGVAYLDYVSAIKDNPVAKTVKLADIKHNLDKTRFAGVEIEQDILKRLRDKYSAALKILNG